MFSQSLHIIQPVFLYQVGWLTLVLMHAIITHLYYRTCTLASFGYLLIIAFDIFGFILLLSKSANFIINSHSIICIILIKIKTNILNNYHKFIFIEFVSNTFVLNIFFLILLNLLQLIL